jgi:hypothetical protein
MIHRDSFRGELVRFGRAMKRYCLRWHLHRYPIALLREWMSADDRMLGWPTSDAAYADWKAGLPAPRRLYKRKSRVPQRPQLHVIEGHGG